MTPEQEAEIISYFRKESPPKNFPYQGEFYESVRSACVSKIRSRTDLKSIGNNFIEDVCDQLAINAWTTLLNDELLDCGYDPKGGLSLVGWFSRFAPQRLLDLINKESRQRSIERKSFDFGGSVDAGFDNFIRQIKFSPQTRSRLTQPFKTLGLQLGDLLAWDSISDLEDQFTNFVSNLTSWPSLLDKRKTEGQRSIDNALMKLETSVNHLASLTPDRMDHPEHISISTLETWRQQQEVVRRRERRYRKACIEGCWFPLNSDDLKNLMQLTSVANAQQLRSRSRKRMFDLVTTGDSNNDQKIQLRFYSDQDLNETEVSIHDIDIKNQGDELSTGGE